MSDLLEDLKELEYRLKREGYEVDHYEIRERTDRNGNIDGRSLQRAGGSTPLEAVCERDQIDSDDYVVEIFMGGKAPLDRLLYEPGRGLETISFSGRKYEIDIDDLLEEDR